MLTTRYVYDNYDRLRYILPPDLADASMNSSVLQKRAFCYKYDELGRMIESSVPGCAPAMFRYSLGGRLVAEHPSTMSEGKWLLHFYDENGREIITSIAPPTDEQIESLCNRLRIAFYLGHNLNGGYHFSNGLPCDIGQLHKVYYYDNYNFISRTDADFGFDSSACPIDKTSKLATGLLAGEIDFSLGSPGRGKVFVYDIDGRVSEQYAMLERGRHHIKRTFDLAGNVLTETESLCNGSLDDINRTTVNTYDSAGRLINTDITENGASASVKRSYGSNGLLSREDFGNKVHRIYKYDIHGWPTSNTISIPLKLNPRQLLKSTPSTYYDSLDALNPDLGSDWDSVQLTDNKHTETLYYTEGATPRYSGCPSARQLIQGGRYDYHFDVHDRLIRADYTPSESAPDGEDFSTEYNYDNLGNPLAVKRYGLTDYITKTFGLVDDLSYTYPDGSSQVSSINSVGEGLDYFGRAGFPLSGSTYSWNEAGLMTADSGNGITNISYNDFGLPVNSKTLKRGNYSTYKYSADGELLNATQVNSRGLLFNTYETIYSAGRIFYGGAGILMSGNYFSYFPGGYFDSNGGVHYIHRDYQGSVVMETDSVGKIEREFAYYPYGEVWESNSGESDRISPTQPQTYQGKEYSAQTGDFDFGPRRYIPSALIWRAPDLKARDYPHISPYTFCASNPIRYADPSGMKLTKSAEEVAQRVIDLTAILQVTTMLSDRKESRVLVECLQIPFEIQKMRDSEHKFDVRYTNAQSTAETEKAMTTYSLGDTKEDDAVVFKLEKNYNPALAVHEFMHGYQFLQGELCLNVEGVTSPRHFNVMHDIYDEKAAYDRGALFGGDQWTLDEIATSKSYKNIIRAPLSQRNYNPLDFRTPKLFATERAFILYGILYKP